MSGREIRLRRLFPASGRRLFGVPLDHSVSLGPIEGIEATRPLAEALLRGGVDLLVVTKGAVRDIAPALRPSSLLGVHMSASTSLSTAPDAKVLVGSASEAVALGADLLSVQVNFGPPQEGEMLRDLGVAVDQCRALGLPLMCMTYVKRSTPATPEEIRHAARAVADLGADIVKTSYPGSLEEMRRLVRSTPVPVLLGGGVRVEDEEGFLLQVRDSVTAGGAGICIGRNLFQRRDPEPLARRVATLLHGGPPA
jgi:2-amino-4,5-dihydroxy-6-oxo-7-(phosphonooxy)heptanoate synthase